MTRWWLMVAGLVVTGCGEGRDEVTQAKEACADAGMDYRLMMHARRDSVLVWVDCIPKDLEPGR